MKEDQIKVDLPAGAGILASRVKYQYPTYMICNSISPICLKILRKNGLQTLPFNLGDPHSTYPFPEKYFDAVIPMATAKDSPTQEAPKYQDIQSNCNSSAVMETLIFNRISND
jgi:hypothetical protein